MPHHRSLCVWLDSYRRDLKSSIAAASEHGFAAVQPNIASTRELSREEFGPSARRHLVRYLRDLGLRLESFAAAFPGAGLAEPEDAERRLLELRRSVELARELGIGRAMVTIGEATEDSLRGLTGQMIDEAADLADRTQVQLSILPMSGSMTTLAEAVRRRGCRGLRIAVDTAGLGGESPGDWAGLTSCLHLRDGRRVGKDIEEVEFGRGNVEFRTVLAQFSRGDEPLPTLVVRQDRAGSVDGLRAGREYVSSLISGGGP